MVLAWPALAVRLTKETLIAFYPGHLGGVGAGGLELNPMLQCLDSHLPHRRCLLRPLKWAQREQGHPPPPARRPPVAAELVLVQTRNTLAAMALVLQPLLPATFYVVLACRASIYACQACNTLEHFGAIIGLCKFHNKLAAESTFR